MIFKSVHILLLNKLTKLLSYRWRFWNIELFFFKSDNEQQSQTAEAYTSVSLKNDVYNKKSYNIKLFLNFEIKTTLVLFFSIIPIKISFKNILLELLIPAAYYRKECPYESYNVLKKINPLFTYFFL